MKSAAGIVSAALFAMTENDSDACSTPVLGEEYGNDKSRREGGTGEVDGVVAQAAGMLKSGSQQAIDDSPEKGGAEHRKAELRQQEIGPLASCADNDDCDEGKDGADDGDSAVLAGCDPTACGDEVRVPAHGLTKFAADRVSSSFGERCRSSGEQNIASVRQKNERRGADGGDR